MLLNFIIIFFCLIIFFFFIFFIYFFFWFGGGGGGGGGPPPASPWHSDFIAILKRIRTEVVKTLVRSVRLGSDVLVSDLLVGNGPCV